MTPELEALARHRLVRASEAFGEGEHLLARGAAAGAVNRFYYAAFHAARALLAIREVDSPRHSGVISLFQQHFVKEGPIASETAKALARSFEKRQDADYEDFAVVSPEDAETIRREVQVFIEECGRTLERLLSSE